MADLNLQNIQDAKDVINETQVELTEYMRIVMNSETFLVPVESVLSVLRPAPLTPVPMAPDHLMGVANIRGQIFCVIDPGKTLHLLHQRKKSTSASRFILLRHPRVRLGIWVEDVLDLLRLVPPEKPEQSVQGYVLGKVDTEYGALQILRVDALFE